MRTEADETVDAASLARIEGKLEVGLATIGGKIDTSMAGMNARVDALDGRITRVEQAHEELRQDTTHKPLSGVSIAGLAASIAGVLIAALTVTILLITSVHQAG